MSQRGQRTRSGLLDAARTVFEREGFLDARITDITDAAGVAHGTFYTYFTSKEEIFREAVRLLGETMLDEAKPASSVQAQSVEARISEANRAFLRSYQSHAPMIALVEQVATFDAEMREFRRQSREVFVRRVERQIRRLRADGDVDVVLEPRYAAEALCSMVERFAYVWMVLGEDYEHDAALHTLNVLWCRALGLGDPPI
ncbi:MAG: TetR/AcrR family transcriptional regulator [Ilumatobacter sp.]